VAVDDILTTLGVVLVVNLIGVGALVMVSVRIVAGFWPTILRALLCAGLVFVLTILIAWTLQLLLGTDRGHVPTMAITLVINAVVMNSFIRAPDGTSIGLLKAGLAALIQLAVEAAVIALLAIVLGLSIFQAVQNAH
jgi:hypothetical protein